MVLSHLIPDSPEAGATQAVPPEAGAPANRAADVR